MGRRSYTDTEKAEALALYATDGPTAVQHQLGIPKQTVASWATSEGVRTVRTEQTRAAVEASIEKWAERRARLVHEMGDVAELALEAAKAALHDGTSSKAKDYATTMAILVDKAQLLSGAATGRHEVTDPRHRLEAARDELAERRGRSAA